MSLCKNQRKRRKRLLSENPYCHWCGKGVFEYKVQKGNTEPDDMATLDHLRSRLHPLKRAPNGGEPLTVLSCRKCNHLRGAEEERSLELEKLHKCSGRYGQKI